MGKQENDLTKNPDKALILAGVRTGGTLLSHALDSHPQIFFVRGEPLHHGNVWANFLPERERLDLIFSQTGYLVAGCKLLLVQLYHKGIPEYVQEVAPKIIFIYREDLAKQTASFIINREVRNWRLDMRPQHTFDEPPPWEPIEYPPDKFYSTYNMLKGRREEVEQFLEEKATSYIKVSYEQMTEDKEITKLPKKCGNTICSFLEVPKRRLVVTLRKVNKQAPEELFSNWDDIKKVL